MNWHTYTTIGEFKNDPALLWLYTSISSSPSSAEDEEMWHHFFIVSDDIDDPKRGFLVREDPNRQKVTYAAFVELETIMNNLNYSLQHSENIEISELLK